MGLKAIYCNEDVLEPTMAKSGAGASASSDFSGKDIIGYAAVMAAITALSGCISPTTTTTVTETNKNEVQHSASGEGGKPTQDAAAPASGNDELPPHLVQVEKGVNNFDDMPRNYDNAPITCCFLEWRDFRRGATPDNATYGNLYAGHQAGTYVFEFQGVDHQGDKDIAHFDVYFSSVYNLGADGKKDEVVKTRHIDLEVDQSDLRFTHGAEPPAAIKQYIQIINSKKDTTSGPIAVLNFPSNGLYSKGIWQDGVPSDPNWDFKLIARVTKMQDGYPGTEQPNAADSATLQVHAYTVEKK